ncbi:hypothetical protein [Dyadobacter sp. CY312]|uniref:hypothetical protein n=1 Tax=Dyadobacter sp. CY312 TaxID=2907303 RepID=UPI001F3AA9FE|nr:hypothetical protein [Dyadobacter sp. CY312]MCE7042603.1 hypothetical protein [Dyadobacter sp. CY312]
MKHQLNKIAVLLVLIIHLITACKEVNPGTPSTNSTGNLTYYVDSQNGNDANSGLSETLAWKTFARVNSTTFVGGDKILLKSGGVWSSRLHPLGSGSIDNPITLSSYGDAARPVINGAGLAGAVVLLKNQSHWVIEGLEITNTADVRSNTYRWGIQVENANGGVLSNIKIINNYVHHVTGSFRWADGFIGPHLNGGIGVNVTGTSGTDKFDNVLIESNTVSYSGRTGIVVWDNVWNNATHATTNVKVRRNKVEFIDSDGILTYGCNGALLEYNVANTCGNYAESGQFNGSCAIWFTRGSDCISQFNEAYNTKALLDNADGQGFDIDLDATNGIVQYNYSHDNAGGFLLLIDARGDPSVQNGTSGSIVRYNISQNDGARIINFAGGVAPNSAIYNNIFYVGSGLSTNIIDHSWDLDMTQPYYFKNNIIYNLGSGTYRIPGNAGSFDYNLYFGNHPVSEPWEAHKLTSDPLFVSAGSGGLGINSLDGYKIAGSSPAAGSGVFITNPGAQDFWGTTISLLNLPSRGAHFIAGAPVGTTGQTTIDPLNSFGNTYGHSANMVIDSSNPSYFENDSARVTRSDANAGTLVYNLNSISNFSIAVYEFSTDLSKVKFYASANGISWNLVSVNHTPPAATSNGWFKTVFTPASALPAGNNYLKIELSDASSWSTQIGQVSIAHVN